jgi:hypothetical protein
LFNQLQYRSGIETVNPYHHHQQQQQQQQYRLHHKFQQELIGCCGKKLALGFIFW